MSPMPVPPSPPPDASVLAADAMLSCAGWALLAFGAVALIGGYAALVLGRRNGADGDQAAIAAALAGGAIAGTSGVVTLSLTSGANVDSLLAAVWTWASRVAGVIPVLILVLLAAITVARGPGWRRRWRHAHRPKVNLVKAPRPVDLATALGRAAQLLPDDEHEWWARVQAPVLLASELAAIHGDRRGRS